jgi:hypothetical protein
MNFFCKHVGLKKVDNNIGLMWKRGLVLFKSWKHAKN